MPLYVPLATSANIAALVSDETGTGSLVFGTSPQLSAIELGHASDTTITRGAAGSPLVEGKPIGVVLASSAAQVASTNTTSEEVLATIAVPANSLGANGFLVIDVTWVTTNSANNKIHRVRFGAAGAGTGGTSYSGLTVTAVVGNRQLAMISNRNATNSQIGGPGSTAYGSTTSAMPSSSVDTTAAAEIAITSQKATGTETNAIERYVVWLYYKA